MKSQTILVTGSSGFIGYHVSKKLLELGYTVIGIDNENDYYSVILKQQRRFQLLSYDNFSFYHIDLEDQKAVNDIFELHVIDSICHLAAQAGVRYSLENPQSYISSNLVSFYSIIEAAKNYGVKKFIYASSSSVYGDHDEEKTDVDAETSRPVSLYAATKKSNELIAHVYSHVYSLPTCGLRFFTVYGPRGRPDMAYFSFSERIYEGLPITVYNKGEMWRDFTYIDDIVEGILSILFHESNEIYDVVNLGKGSPDKLLDFVNQLQNKLGMKAKILEGESPSVDVFKTSANIEKTTNTYGWKPTTTLEEGLEKFTTWFLKYKEQKSAQKINILQWLPSYPPRKGGLETHAYQWSFRWHHKSYGAVVNIIGALDQNILFDTLKEKDKIYADGIYIGYIDQGVHNIILPTFELIPNFPFPKIRTKQFRRVLKYIKRSYVIDIVVTRTRFFLTTFLGGLYAKRHGLPWMHIEHGSSFVRVSSKITTAIAYMYDQVCGRWILRSASLVVPISKACKRFVGLFTKRSTSLIYRGIDIDYDKIQQQNVDTLAELFPNKIIVGYVGRLYAWKNIDTFIKAYYDLPDSIQDSMQIVVVGDGEDYNRLKKMDTNNSIYFTGGKLFYEALALQKQFDVHVHSSSPGGGISSSLMQAMALGCTILATPYEGADEIIFPNKNGILVDDDSLASLKKGLLQVIRVVGTKEENERKIKNKQLIEQHFSWVNNIDQYYLLCNELL